MSYVLTTCFPASASLVPAQFAAKLALAMNCRLRLVHAYAVPFVIGDFPAPVIAPDEVRIAATRQLESAEGELIRSNPGLQLEASLGYGLLADVLDEAIDAEKPILVVIANDEGANAEPALGTDTASAMNDFAVPVLAVPGNSAAISISHICLALSRDSLQNSPRLEGLDTLQQRLGCKLSILTIAELSDEQEMPANSALQAQLVALGGAFTTLDARDAGLGKIFEEFAIGHGADCIAVLKHERGFFSSLFHRSQTEALLKVSTLPVISFHTVDAG